LGEKGGFSMKKPITTTLQKLKDAKACVERYTHLREALGKDFKLTTVLPLTRILETNGRDDVLWALDNAVDGGDKICRVWAADCVLHIFLKERPKDTRPADAIKAARQFARGQITTAAGDAAAAAAGAAAAAAAGAADAAAAWAADAAWAAAADAAGAAKEKWQIDRLIAYLNNEVTEDWHATKEANG
jgi:hypothetical protein